MAWPISPVTTRPNSPSQTWLLQIDRDFAFWGFPGGSACKESACNVGDLGLIPGWGRSPGEGNGCPLQYSGGRIPWTVSPKKLHRVGHNWVSHFHFCILVALLFVNLCLSCICGGEGNRGNIFLKWGNITDFPLKRCWRKSSLSLASKIRHSVSFLWLYIKQCYNSLFLLNYVIQRQPFS